MLGAHKFNNFNLGVKLNLISWRTHQENSLWWGFWTMCLLWSSIRY